jgi:flagellar biosynthesis chaperone FliJ
MSLSAQRLRRITKHRHRLERMQEQQFAVARKATATRAVALQESVDELTAALAAGGAVAGQLDPALLAAGSAHLVRTKKAIAAKEAALRQSRLVEQAELDELLERRRDRKATESLLESRLVAARTDREQAEARRIDESATRNWQRGRSSRPPTAWEGAER